MKSWFAKEIVVVLMASAGLTASADPADTVWNAQKARAEKLRPQNAARVRALGVQGPVTWFAVPAMSDVMRLEDTWPSDGDHAATVRCVLARGEWESCSFELFSFDDLDNVELKVELALDNDLRVVKRWFQNGNGWVSYFDDIGLKMTPELLLHDENLIRVETGDTPGNWARVRKAGKDEWIWISAPKGLDAKAFDPYDEGFADAAALQPVRLEKNAFKQFFLTIHAAKDRRPGVCAGTITVSRKGQTLAKIPLAVRVLPFELPLPGTYEDPKKAYVYSAMGAMPNLENLLKSFNADEDKAKRCFRTWLQSLYDHSVFHAPYVAPENEWCVPMLREIGFPLDPVFGTLLTPWFGLNFGGRLSYEYLMTARDGADRCHEFYQRAVGHNNILCGHGDEQGAAFVTANREFYKFYARYGIRIGCAGHEALLAKGGYAYGYYPMGGDPADLGRTRPWKELGAYPIGFYAAQHTGSENPQFTRNQHGLQSYLNGLSMTYNYEFAVGSFNDRVNLLYKPMVIAYASGQGLMETIEYAGFREGCDDIRYATCLKLLVAEAQEKGPVENVLLAKKALQFLATLKRDELDLDYVRMEIIEYILKLHTALGK
jgi:hypothetical protein